MSSYHWVHVKEDSFIFGIKILFTIQRIFGRWPFRLVLYPVLVWYVISNAPARRASRDYLSKLYAYRDKTTPKPNLLNVFRHFAAFGEALLDKLIAWSNPNNLTNVDLQRSGAKTMADMLEQGTGGIIITAHIGNFEVCRALAKQRRTALKLTILTHSQHTQKFNRLLHEISPDSQIDLMQVNDLSAASAILLAQKIANGEFIVIAGDRIPVAEQGRSTEVDFLGCKANLPIGAYLVAGILKCPLIAVIPNSCGKKTHISVTKLAERIILPRKNRTQSIAALAQQFADLMAEECSFSPLQWFNFFPFWQQLEHQQKCTK